MLHIDMKKLPFRHSCLITIFKKNNTIPGVPQELDINYSDSSSETYAAKAVHV